MCVVSWLEFQYFLHNIMDEYTPTDADVLYLGLPDDPYWKQQGKEWIRYVSSNTSSRWFSQDLLVSS